MTDQQSTRPTSLTVFFFPYALLEVPSNMVLKVVRPSIWISAMVVAWGAVMTLMGIVRSYEACWCQSCGE